MCGRFVADIFPGLLGTIYNLTAVPQLPPRYNIAPSQDVAAVRESTTGKRELVLLRWGLVPHWAKDASIGTKMINARSETAADKPSFREALRRRRCVIPASGFYEWQRDGKQKIPHYIHPRDGGVLSFAGLWEPWQAPDGAPFESCTILTTRANQLLAGLHERMPVILGADVLDRWLDRQLTDPHHLADLFRPCPAERLTEHVVSSRVNRPGFDGSECIAPLGAAT
jgi:putative SOS response-associated peptidase YedK